MTAGAAAEPVRLGLLAAARIAERAVVEPARRFPGVEIVAIAARDPARAEAAAARWGIPRVHRSYKALVADDTVEAVYVASPAALHRAHSLLVLRAGRHLLVEKPLAANADDAQRIADAAPPDVVAMEAMHSRHHPVHDDVRRLIDEGVIGNVRSAETHFLIRRGHIPADDIRWDLSLGGGAMMDLGIYPVTWLRMLFGDGWRVIDAHARPGRDPRVDAALTARLQWPGGVEAELVASMQARVRRHTSALTVIGDGGRIELHNPLAPQQGASLQLHPAGLRRARTLPVDPTPTYDLQLAAFHDAIRRGAAPITTLAEGVASMRMVDACYVAAGLEPRPAAAER